MLVHVLAVQARLAGLLLGQRLEIIGDAALIFIRHSIRAPRAQAVRRQARELVRDPRLVALEGARDVLAQPVPLRVVLLPGFGAGRGPAPLVLLRRRSPRARFGRAALEAIHHVARALRFARVFLLKALEIARCTAALPVR